MTLTAHFDGKVFIPEGSVSLPVGRKVWIEVDPAELPDDDPDPLGTTGDPQLSDPESIAEWIEEMRSIPAAVLTSEEEAQWRDDRKRRQKLHEAGMDALIERLNGMNS